MRFVTWLLTNAFALAIAAWILPGISFDGPNAGMDELQEKAIPVLIVALILGLVSSTVKPVLKLLSLPLIILTIGLFLLVINALMLMLTEWIGKQFDIGFHVDGFWWAVAGSIVITIVSSLVDSVLNDD